MYYCPQCRNEILIEAHFCDICGYRLDDRGSLAKVRTQVTPPLFPQPEPAQRPKVLPTGQLTVEVIKGKSHLKDIQERLDPFENDESFVATSLAAEHWRTSWRNRQRTEAGPATIVTRGHSHVPEPLLAMQNSLLSMRAIIGPKKDRDHSGPGFWMTIILMICIIGGLGAYFISMYLPVADTSVHMHRPLVTPPPALTIQGASFATNVSLSTPSLTFQALTGQGNPKEQFVTLTNTSNGTQLKWTATAQTDGNESWLVIDESTLSGSLNVGGSSRVGIRVTITGLKSNDQPYTGRILFKINQVQQLTLPVQLYMQDGVAELVISPVHIVGSVSPTNTCLPGAQLTLINISNSRINWRLNMDDTTVQHIQFIYQGKLVQQGQLAPAGLQGDTQVLTMNCAFVQAGNTFLFTVYANNIPSPVTVSIQAPS